MLAKLPGVGGLQYLRTLLEPALTLGAARFTAPHAPLADRRECECTADIPLSAPGSGLLGLAADDDWPAPVGFPVPEGGAGALSAALAPSALRRWAVKIRCGVRVD